MVPNKLLRVLGYNNLSVILMQERRHWLLKTNKNKQIQDSVTGDVFQGRIDNAGADIVIESKKLPYKYDFTTDIQFALTHADEILDIKLSALPHSACVNGLMYARIISINYQYNDNPKQYSSYKLKFTNASECLIPFGASSTSDEVYAGKWIKTTTAPTLMIYDNSTHDYTIERQLTFNGASNIVWYYPMEESLQPLDITKSGTTYTTAAVDNNNYIGDPLFWFTCNESNIGSNVTFTDNIGSTNKQIMYISNPGNATPYDAKIYVGVDGNDDATPSGASINGFSIQVSPISGRSFNNNSADFEVPLDGVITFYNNNTSQSYTVTLTFNENDVLTMDNASGVWSYVDANTYSIPMSYFTVNCYENQLNDPLVALLDMTFDNTVPFVKSTTDYGYAGMRFYAGNPNNDTVDRYPYNLNLWSGLPSWLTDATANTVQEHGVVYAMHNAPSSDPQNPETLQGAGLIFDPGLVPDPHQEEVPKGRVYVLSNDDLKYENNKLAQFPKPDRTAARICDIPTSAMDFMNPEDLTPTQVVDKKYTRTETSYSVTDKGMLYNDLASRWVKPTAYTANGNMAYLEYQLTNKFVFESIEELLGVDVTSTRNNFRYTINLDPQVDVQYVDVNIITNPGENYAVTDQGLCIVGGSSFTYEVYAVDDNGGVTDVRIAPNQVTYIPLCNFDMVSDTSYVTEEYGTSPLTGDGTGLKFRFQISQSHLDEIKTQPGENFEDLFALVREPDGLYLYTYEIDQTSVTFPKEGAWVRGMLISEFEITDTNMSHENYGVSTQESFVNSVLPNVETLPVAQYRDNVDPTSIQVLQTASCVNVIDITHTPVVPSLVTDPDTLASVVDISKFYCDGIIQAALISGAQHNSQGIIDTLKFHGKIFFDSYIIWRWVYPENPSSGRFEYGIVRRGFSNLFSTDSQTKLPRNELRSDKFVHFNAGTTIIWNVSGIGPMVWMYDSTSTTRETYRIDPQTMDLDVIRNEFSYADIEVRVGTEEEPVKIVEDGKYLWNVLTNCRQNIPDFEPEYTDPLYINPEVVPLNNVMVGLNVSDTPAVEKMMGNWKLVFPRVNTCHLSSDTTGTQLAVKRLQTIKSRGVVPADTDRVIDNEGNDVSAKTLIISESAEGTEVRVFNTEANRWDSI